MKKRQQSTKQKYINFNYRVNASLHSQLKEYCKQTEQSIAYFVSELIKKELNKNFD